MVVSVSVVIPCYNQGHFVVETIDSVLASDLDDLEIIVINDGSTDEYTNTLLTNLTKPKTKVIFTDNQGVCSARNKGIEMAKGRYIFPLDADDLIYPQYLSKAKKILDEKSDIGIVYAQGELFGLQSGEWKLKPYNFSRFLNSNSIPVCAMFRKQDYIRTKGYNSNMVYGLEDWDFWLSLLELGVGVAKIEEVLFRYRIQSVSRTSKMKMFMNESRKQIVKNHFRLYAKNVFRLKPQYVRILFEKENRTQIYKNDKILYLKLLLSKIKILPDDIFCCIKASFKKRIKEKP